MMESLSNSATDSNLDSYNRRSMLVRADCLTWRIWAYARLSLF